MVAKKIRKLLHSKPFQFFRIRENNGKTYRVVGPEPIVLMKFRIAIAALRSDHCAIGSFFQIEGTELIKTRSAHRLPRRERK